MPPKKNSKAPQTYTRWAIYSSPKSFVLDSFIPLLYSIRIYCVNFLAILYSPIKKARARIADNKRAIRKNWRFSEKVEVYD